MEEKTRHAKSKRKNFALRFLKNTNPQMKFCPLGVIVEFYFFILGQSSYQIQFSFKSFWVKVRTTCVPIPSTKITIGILQVKSSGNSSRLFCFRSSTSYASLVNVSGLQVTTVYSQLWCFCEH